MCPKRERMVSQEVDQEVGVEQGNTPSLAVLQRMYYEFAHKIWVLIALLHRLARAFIAHIRKV